MRITIDTDVLIENELSADEYVYLYLLQNRAYNILSTLDLEVDLFELQEMNYITGDTMDTMTLKVSPLGTQILGLNEEKESDFSAIFRKLFQPAGAGMTGDKYLVETRMKWFKMNYDFDDQTILLGAQMYISSKRKDRYTYMSNAHNFIQKFDSMGNPESMLAAWCETAKTADDTEDDQYHV